MSSTCLELGQIVATAGVAAWVDENSAERLTGITKSLVRHRNGDWGNVCDEDAKANDEAAAGEYRVLSAYEVDDRKVWIITEWDRSVTTILFPEEY